jgi:hypothetical protein
MQANKKIIGFKAFLGKGPTTVNQIRKMSNMRLFLSPSAGPGSFKVKKNVSLLGRGLSSKKIKFGEHLAVKDAARHLSTHMLDHKKISKASSGSFGS